MFRRTQFALIYNMQTIVITDMVLDQHLTHEEARNAHIFNQVLGQAIDMAMGQKKKLWQKPATFQVPNQGWLGPAWRILSWYKGCL